ncbi:MAG TPA: polysaccharide deacetylase family protein [Selenomonadales bacterium]|nr:polysaccharide deacetylase family protein [Selenomonadales bacterium]
MRSTWKIAVLVVAALWLAACTPAQKPETSIQSDVGNAASAADAQFKRGQNIPGRLYWAGSAQDKKVALTFDDGPDNIWTPKILDILNRKGVKATFFVLGSQAQRCPDMLRRIDAEGHVIGNHTFDHVNLATVGSPKADKELDECANIVQNITGKRPRLVRPPFGFHNPTVDKLVYAKGEIIVLWSLDTEDWKGYDSRTVKQRILPKMKNGFIVLQHDGANPHLGGTVQALPEIIDGLREQGYTLVTIPELLNVEPYQ